MDSTTKANILLAGLRHEFQYVQSANPSLTEQDQRRSFLTRVGMLIKAFNPTVVADENLHTNNQEFLSLLPATPLLIDLPHQERIAQHLYLRRPNAGLTLCRCVDSVREKFWKEKIDETVRDQPGSRILVFVGSLHLRRFPSKPESFADLLESNGYSVSSIDLTAERWAEGEWK